MARLLSRLPHRLALASLLALTFALAILVAIRLEFIRSRNDRLKREALSREVPA